MNRETGIILFLIYFFGGIFTFICLGTIFVEPGEAMTGAQFQDIITYAALWPAFLLKYVLLGIAFLLSNGFTLLF